jgi:hypothetical protein
MKVNSCAMVFDDIGCYHNLEPKQEGPVNTDLIESVSSLRHWASQMNIQ